MTKEEIQDLARKHANQFAITHPDEDWSSHYYGFIYGFQKAQELATNDGSASVRLSLPSDDEIKSMCNFDSFPEAVEDIGFPLHWLKKRYVTHPRHTQNQ